MKKIFKCGANNKKVEPEKRLVEAEKKYIKKQYTKKYDSYESKKNTHVDNLFDNSVTVDKIDENNNLESEAKNDKFN